MLGGVQVTARLRITGNYPELVGRLWDVNPDGTRQIAAMGVVRPPVNQGVGDQAAGTPATTVATRRSRFELNPNDYTFAPGDTIELELVGSNAPYFRASNGTFQMTVDRPRRQGADDLTGQLDLAEPLCLS